MAIKDGDKDWIRTEIRTAIQEHLNPNGWRKLQGYLPLVGILGVFVALLALAAGGWNYAFSRVGQEAAFQAHTTDTLNLTAARLTRIEGELGILQAQNAATKYSTIPIKELRGHRDELASVKNNLASLPQDVPNFWPASFQIITLLSQANSQLETIGKQPLSVMSDVRYINMPGLIGFAVRDNNVLLKNLVEGVTFTNSVVHFDPSVRLVNDTFINCVFVFPADENPPKSLQEIGKTLLASDLSKVTLNAS